jgi:phosphatidylglycerol---prolipoprotein diacylglyceryl transferase
MFPVLFRIAGFEIRSYGVLIAAGIIAGIYIGASELRRKGLPPALMAEFAPYGIISGLVLSRIVFVVTHAEYFRDAPFQAFNLRAGGLSFFGGLAGGVIAAFIFLRIKKISFLRFADCAAPALAAALFFGRIGCFLNGCCYGIPTSLPWAVTYENIRSSAPLGIPLHPAQLYEAAGNLLIFAVLFGFREKRFLSKGAFFFFLFLYSGLRLFNERFRADTLAFITPRFAWTELFFAVIMSFALIMFLIQKRGSESAGEEKKKPSQKEHTA